MDRAPAPALDASRRRALVAPDAHRWLTPEERKWLLPERKQAVTQLQPDDHGLDLAAEREWLHRTRGELASLKAELKFQQFLRSLKAGFRHDQPRVPAGNPEGGRWTTGAGAAQPGVVNNSNLTRGGHHFVTRDIFDDPVLRLRPETRKVFEQGVTGPLNAGPHRWDREHKTYNQAVRELFNRFLDANRTTSEEMTPDHARRFLDEVKRSTDPRIRGLNIRIYMREVIFWMRRAPRGSD